MFSLLKYTNNKFEIDDIIFTNDIVKQTNPEYACDDSIKELFYQVGNPNNCIYYKDESVVSLSDFEPKYNELILLASKFQFEQNEQLIKEQLSILNAPKPKISLKDLFQVNITLKEQEDLIKQLNQTIPNLIIDNEFLIKVLNKVKKKLLKESDWTQLPDVQISFNEEEKEAWINYRASLRTLDNIQNPLDARIPLMPQD